MKLVEGGALSWLQQAKSLYRAVFLLVCLSASIIMLCSCAQGDVGSEVHSQNSGVSLSENLSAPSETESTDVSREQYREAVLEVIVNETVFTAQLADNESARAFLELLPMTVALSDTNSNEKAYYSDQQLSFDSTETPDVIHAGEIMIWSGNYLVLFYEEFPNTYAGYNRIASIEDTTGLAEALGAGDVQVTFRAQ